MKELDFLEALLQEQAERHEREPIGEMTFTLPTTTHVKPSEFMGLVYDAINPNLNIACTGSYRPNAK
jgi:hypothetical protein